MAGVGGHPGDKSQRSPWDPIPGLCQLNMFNIQIKNSEINATFHSIDELDPYRLKPVKRTHRGLPGLRCRFIDINLNEVISQFSILGLALLEEESPYGPDGLKPGGYIKKMTSHS